MSLSDEEDLSLTSGTAIIGMSCRFAGSDSPNEFWEFLASGKDGIGPYPANRPGCENASASSESFECGFLKSPIDEFDAKFFGISPREAPFIDPQQRLLLQVTWEALESAGINPLSLKGSDTSAFVGIHMADYEKLVKPVGASEFHHTYLGNAFSATASRISFFLGLTGPNLAIESGCSSSLIGLHLAVQSLQRGESSVALACGVNLIARRNVKGTVALEAVLSPDCRCKTFDASANGFARAEGVGTVVLKRYSDAVRDGDAILGIVRGTASNNDGPGQSFGTPNAKSQERVIAEALKAANISPAEVSYVEAHGTGTPVGDPLEMEALRVAYSKGRREPLMIGSVKTNIGHTESAAGIAGLIKVLLCMKNSAIPPHLHLKMLNPAIDLKSIPALIPTQLTPWSNSNKIAGLSSFSMSGTSAHAIIQQAPTVVKLNTGAPGPGLQHIVALSAKTPASLHNLTLKYLEFLKTTQTKQPVAAAELNLESVSFTSTVCRAHFPQHRATILASTLPECIAELEKLAAKGPTGNEAPAAATATAGSRKIVFLFSGQGSQHVGMGKELYQHSEPFKSALDDCERLFSNNLGVSLKDVLWKVGAGSPSLLEQTIYCQPALFCLQYALVQHWKSLGVVADVVLGHSIGEFAAAVTAGLLSLEEAMVLVIERSRLVDGLPRGQMLVVKTNVKAVEGHIKAFQGQGGGLVVDIAAVNSSTEVVVSGTPESIAAFEEYLLGVGAGASGGTGTLKVKRLAASSAFHSREMDPVMKELTAIVSSRQINSNNGKAKPKPSSSCTFISATLAKFMSPTDFDYSSNPTTCYWAQHLRQRVQFAKAVTLLEGQPNLTFIEIGPQPILLALAMSTLSYEPTALFCPTLKSTEKEWTTFTNSLSVLYLSGLEVNWRALYPSSFTKAGHLVPLPHYAFEMQKYWVPEANLEPNSAVVVHPVIGRQLSSSLPIQIHVAQVSIEGPALSYLQDHKVGSIPILPAAAFLEASLSIGQQLLGGGGGGAGGSSSTPLIIQDLIIESALALPEHGGSSTHLETLVNRSAPGAHDGLNYEITFNSTTPPRSSNKDSSSSWKRHARANFRPGSKLGRKISLNLEELKGQLEARREPTLVKWYDSLQSVGIEFGPKFRSLALAWSNERFLLAKVAPAAAAALAIDDADESYVLHPIIIDAMIQASAFGFSLAAAAAAVEGDGAGEGVVVEKELRLPLSIGAFTWYGRPQPQLQAPPPATVTEAEAVGRHRPALYVYCSKEEDGWSWLVDEEGNTLAVMSGLELVKVKLEPFLKSLVARSDEVQPSFYKQVWRKLPAQASRVDMSLLTQQQQQLLALTDGATQQQQQEKEKEQVSMGLEEVPTWKDPRFDQLCYFYIAKALQEAKFSWPPPGERLSFAKHWAPFLPKALKNTKIHQGFLNVLAKHGGGGGGGHVELSTGKVLSKLPSIRECSSAIKELEKGIHEENESELVYLEFVSHCGQQLPLVLAGQVQPLSVLYPSDPNVTGASKVATETNCSKVRLAVAKEIISAQLRPLVAVGTPAASTTPATTPLPVLRLLEVGGGSGAATLTFMELLTELGIPFHYTFTDITTQFLDEAQSKFGKDYAQVMEFKVLDIDKDGLGQGFAPESYDVIISFHVLHVAAAIQPTLEHLKLLLAEGGLLYVWERYEIPAFYNMSYALLDTFWRFKDTELRTESPILSEATWIQQLARAGYSSIEKLYTTAAGQGRLEEQGQGGGGGGGGGGGYHEDGALVARKCSASSGTSFLAGERSGGADAAAIPSNNCHWILFNVEPEIEPYLHKLASKLSAYGRSTLLVSHSSCTAAAPLLKENNGAGGANCWWEMDFGSDSHLEQLFSQINSKFDGLLTSGGGGGGGGRSGKLEGILYFSTTTNTSNLGGVLPPEGNSGRDPACTNLDEAQKIIFGGLLKLAHQLAAYEIHRTKLIVLTQGVYSVQHSCCPANATAWGFMRNFIAEYQQFDAKIVDLPELESLSCVNSSAPAGALNRQLLRVMFELGSEEKFIRMDLSGGEAAAAAAAATLSVQRITNYPKPPPPVRIPPVERWTVVVPTTGLISDIEVRPTHGGGGEEELGEHYVEIAVRAAGLNFRDLMVILKPDGHEAFLPADSNSFAGLDVSGAICAVGSGVRGWKVGDEVIAVTKHGLASHTIVHERCLMPKPTFITFPSASTIPCVFFTSYYGLVELGKVNKADRVLIHVGAGGIGLSAIQIVKRAGATIYTTAGSERKRNYLRHSLGIRYVYSSRDLEYKERLLRDTHGQGVTLVLNSLTGPGFKEATLQSCSRGARFIEIGKVNIWTSEEVRQLRPDVEYHAIDLYPMISSTSQKEGSMISEYMKLIGSFLEEKTVSPLPLTTFPLERIQDAFNFFMKARNIGKIVIKMPEINMEVSPQIELVHKLFEAEATYLITGGLGGIGFEMVGWMIGHGARNIVLVGRNPPSPAQAQVMERIMESRASRDVQLLALQADVGVFAQCQNLFTAPVLKKLPPLRGVMLASGVIQDSFISNMSWEKVEAVFRSKLHAAWNLHLLTAQHNLVDLDHFILFSSGTASIGTAGQSNHSAACSFLDTLANYRRSLGLVATTINWGPWAEVGAASNLSIGQKSWFGSQSFSPEAGFKALEKFMTLNYAQATIITVTDWAALKETTNSKNYFIETAGDEKSGGGRELGKAEEEELWAAILATRGGEERKLKMQAYLTRLLKRILKFGEADNIDPNADLAELGVDSLMTMEMRNQIQRLLGSSKILTANSVQENRTINNLTTHLVQLLSKDIDLVKEKEILTALIRSDCVLPEDIKTKVVGVPPPPGTRSTQFSQILVTGGTGFLGSHIIHELLASTQARLVCLVRASSAEEGEARVLATLDMYGLLAPTPDERLRLKVVVGNMVHEHFDLPPEEYTLLANSTDAVINCAVSRNLLELYTASSSELESSLRSINVNGLLNCLRFSVAGKVKHFYHPSYFTAVTDLTPDGNITERFLTVQDNFEGFENGYIISKFIGEVLIAQAAQLGLPATIMRFPGLWGGNAEAAEVHGREVTHIASLIRACIQLRKCPILEEGSKFPAMTADVAANLVSQLVTSLEAELGVYNLVASKSVDNIDLALINEMIAEFNIEMEFLEFQEWRDAFFDTEQNSALMAFRYLYEDVNDGGIRLLALHPLFNADSKLPGFVGDKIYRNMLEPLEPEITMPELLAIYCKDVL